MTLQGEFGRGAQLIHTHTYTDNPSQKWLDREREELLQIAGELGIEMELRQVRLGFEFGFSNVVDQARFRSAAFEHDQAPGEHRHTEEFDDPGLQARWTAAVVETLGEVGAPFRLEQRGNAVEFTFDSMADHAAFVALRDQGVFAEMADRPHSAQDGWSPSLN